MKIASWNVNSLNVRLPHLQRWLDEAKPDVVGLSVGCTYGYGEPHELEDADFRISDIRELVDILR